MPKPLLIVSDSPSSSSGLGRITRDLALRIHDNLKNEFRLATAGYGGQGDRAFGWTDYHFHSIENWLLPELPQIAENFAGNEELTILFVWDASRLQWVGNPELCPVPHLKQWLKTAKLKKWIYPAVDAEGPNGKLAFPLQVALKGFDRVLNYSNFSAGITGYPEYLPHGIDTEVFRHWNRKECKREFQSSGFHNLGEEDLLIGIVATNQQRKDWALGIQTCAELAKRGLPVKVWCHTDQTFRHWDIIELLIDYGLIQNSCVSTTILTDAKMSRLYSACDVTLGIGSEGFGYPIYESLACGTPCVHGDYAGGAEWLPPAMKVTPTAWRYDGAFCSKRPVFDPSEWADRVMACMILGDVQLPNRLQWKNLWSEWETWFREGL